MRYWLYKNNSIDGGPAGYRGDWLKEVFTKKGPVRWGGHYSTESYEVAKHLEQDVTVGDVVAAYQTDITSVVGFCRVADIKVSSRSHSHSTPVGLELHLQPIAVITPFRIHRYKRGTVLEHSIAVNGPVMLRELEPNEMKELVRISGASKSVLKGQPPVGGWRPLTRASKSNS